MSKVESKKDYGKAAVEFVNSFVDLAKKKFFRGLKEGDPAPDFELETKDRDQKIRLSSFRGVKPVVLIFGSYT